MMCEASSQQISMENSSHWNNFMLIVICHMFDMSKFHIFDSKLDSSLLSKALSYW